MINIASTGIYNASNGATTAPIPKPTGLAVGDLMVAVISTVISAITSAPTGWTVVNSNNLTYNFCTVYKKIADASDVSASTFSWSGTYAIGGIIYRIPEGDFNNIQMSLNAPLTPKTKDNAIILVGTSSDDDSDSCTFSGYSTTGGATVTYTENYDSLGTSSSYYAAMGVASGIHSSFDNITAFNVTADASPDATSRFMILIGDIYSVNHNDLFKNCVAYYDFEGNSNDKSIYANNGADTDMTYLEVGGKQGKYANCNGSSSQISVPSSESLSPKDAISISVWVRQNIGQASMIFQKSGSYYSYGYTSYRSLWIGTTLGNLELYSGGGALDDGKWHHFVFTWSNSDGYIRIYVDGKLQATSSTTLFGVLNQNSNNFYICSGGNQYFHGGQIDQLRIWNRVISIDEVRLLYSLSKSLHNGLISYWKLDGNSYDFIGKNDGIDKDIIYNASYGKIGQGADFNGSSSEIVIGDKCKILNEMTFSFWFKTDTIPFVGSPLSKGNEFLMRQDYDSIFFRLFDGTDWEPAVRTSQLSANTWYHCVCVHTISAGTATKKIYLNGNLEQTNTQTGIFSQTTNPLYIGRWAGGEWFDGKLDEIAIWNRVLTPEEIQQLFYAGNGNQYPLQTNMADMM